MPEPRKAIVYWNCPYCSKVSTWVLGDLLIAAPDGPYDPDNRIIKLFCPFPCSGGYWLDPLQLLVLAKHTDKKG